MQVNAYFKLQMQPDGIYIVVFAAKEGGVPLNINEVVAYLDKYKYNAYDLKQLNQAVMGVTDGVRIRVADNKGDSVDEEMYIETSLDKMFLNVRFYPPSNNGRPITMDEIMMILERMGVKAEINKKVLQDYLNDREYCKTFMIAQGKPPVRGKDATIEYLFNTDHNLKPKRNEDGSVDYKSLDMIGHVSKGDCLAILHKEDPGKPGMDVYGAPIKPNTVKRLHLSYGNNISVSEDGTQIFSDVTGHANLVNGKVFVSDVYEVPADVDNSTGNITYDGNVHVKGNVKSGFEINAKGDIIVEGVVEAATLISGGQIVVKRGIHGMAKGVLKAEGNVVTKFIENAEVVAGGYVETEIIMHSQVSANTNVVVNGKKGFVTGGVIRAGDLVEAQTIGSDMGALTEIEVGMPPAKKERMLQLAKSISKHEGELEQIKPVLASYTAKLSKGGKLPPDRLAYVKNLADNFKKTQETIAAEQKEMELLKQEMIKGNKAKVKVHKDVFPGVTVSISDLKKTMQSQRSFCQFIRNNGTIEVINL